MGRAKGKTKAADKPTRTYWKLTKAAAAEAKALATLWNPEPPAPPPPPAPLDPAVGAAAIRANGGAAHLLVALGDLYGPTFGLDSFRAYLDPLTAGYADPLDRLLAEQAVVASHAASRLASRAASAVGASQAAAFAAGAARLAAECRRHAVALRDRRTDAKAEATGQKTANIELVSKRTPTTGRATDGEEPEAGRRRQAQPGQAGPAIGRGTGAVAGGGVAVAAVAAVDRAHVGGRQGGVGGQRPCPAGRRAVGPAGPRTLVRPDAVPGRDGRGKGGVPAKRKALGQRTPPPRRKRRAAVSA